MMESNDDDLLILYVFVCVSCVFCLLYVCMFALFLLLATWLLTQYLIKEESNQITPLHSVILYKFICISLKNF